MSTLQLINPWVTPITNAFAFNIMGRAAFLLSSLLNAHSENLSIEKPFSQFLLREGKSQQMQLLQQRLEQHLLSNTVVPHLLQSIKFCSYFPMLLPYLLFPVQSRDTLNFSIISIHSQPWRRFGHQIFAKDLHINYKMFCCTRKESHKGEIVTSLCLEQTCTNAKNQLSCSLCLQEEHSDHNYTTLKKIMPQLLDAEREKQIYVEQLRQLTQFVWRQFGEQNESGEQISLNNIVQRVQELLGQLKQQVQTTNQQMSKMKSIFKNLNKNNNNSFIKTTPNKYEEEGNRLESPLKSSNGSQLFKNNSSPNKSKMLSQAQMSVISDLDCFSHTSKHPYLSISSDMRTATKVSHSGHRFAAIGGKPLSQKQHQLRVKIDKSISGNILIGLCHQSIVRQKQFCNCYGIGTGTYLIGQNGNNSNTAISFHHSVAVLNRKQVVGWNFIQGDIVMIGVNFQNNFIYFRREGKRPSQQFSMKFIGNEAKPEFQASVGEGFKFIVLLQSQGDQVTIVEE